ncbi:MAG: hypothetical protein V4439_04425 [Patescibacteria group bacterium]
MFKEEEYKRALREELSKEIHDAKARIVLLKAQLDDLKFSTKPEDQEHCHQLEQVINLLEILSRPIEDY